MGHAQATRLSPHLFAANEARIGPNAILQTLLAMRDLESPALELEAQVRAGLSLPLAPGMVPEALFVSLLAAVRSMIPPARAEAVLRRAGKTTADYVRQNRVPAPFRSLLGTLPPRISEPLLLKAFQKHAWTFAGGGRFEVQGAFPGVLRLFDAPTCRAEANATGGALYGSYYEAAFEGLLAMVAPRVRVREVACQAAGAPCCTFEISL